VRGKRWGSAEVAPLFRPYLSTITAEGKKKTKVSRAVSIDSQGVGNGRPAIGRKKKRERERKKGSDDTKRRMLPIRALPSTLKKKKEEGKEKPSVTCCRMFNGVAAGKTLSNYAR